MAGDLDGSEATCEAKGPASDVSAQEASSQQVKGNDGPENPSGLPAEATDYEKAIGERDARIAELEAQVAEAAKTAQTVDELRAQIAELKAQGESDRVDFRLRLAGARNLKAARAVLADHDGDVEALVVAEPWLFDSTRTQRPGGATGLEPAGASGGSTERDYRRWERIAGLTDEEA